MKCILCDNIDFEVVYDGIIRSGSPGKLTKENHQIIKCTSCGITKIKEFPKIDYDSGKYRLEYNDSSSISDYYSAHDEEQNDRISKIGIQNFRDKIVLDFGCGGHGTLQHTLFNHYPNSIYYGLDTDFVSHDNYGFIDNKNKSQNNIFFKNIDKLDEVLPKVDCMIMGSVFTHLSISKIEEILDKTLPFYKNGFQLGFTAFMGDKFSFVGEGPYGPDTYTYTILDYNWFKEYCFKI